MFSGVVVLRERWRVAVALARVWWRLVRAGWRTVFADARSGSRGRRKRLFMVVLVLGLFGEVVGDVVGDLL